jgi:hypothetical protein
MGFWQNKRKRWVSIASGTAVVAAAAIATSVYTSQVPAVRDTLLQMLVMRDIGALPARGTGAGQFCGDMGWDAPQNCYYTGGTGNLTDYGTQGVTLAKMGSGHREGVVAGLPVRDGSGGVSWTSEKTTYVDGTGYYANFSGHTLTLSDKHSVTWIQRSNLPGLSGQPWAFHDSGGHYLYMVQETAGTWQYQARGTGGAGGVGGLDKARQEWACYTLAYDASGANKTKVYRNGATLLTINSTAHGSIGYTNKSIYIMSGPSAAMEGAVTRLRYDGPVALTLEQHQALCGDFTQPLRRTHPAYSDTTWTQTGGARCFAMSATSAVCLPGGAAGYAWDGSRVAWATEPGRVNRLLYSAALNNWTVTGNPELLTDGDMEAVGVGDWTPGSQTTATKENASPHGGAQNAKALNNGSTLQPQVRQVILTVGQYYNLYGWQRGDGTAAPRISTAYATGLPYACMGTSDVAWQECSMIALAYSTSLSLWGSSAAINTFVEFDDVSVTLHGTPAVAPDGSKTAYTISNVATISTTASGYTALSTVYPIMWLKCSAGTLSITNTTGTGNWSVDCTHAALNDNWTLISRNHPAVRVTDAWAADGTGAVTPTFSGTEFTLWLPTITEVEGFSVIPTLASVVSTGSPVWSIDNTTFRRYWQPGAQVTTSGSYSSGPCVVPDVTSVLLSGSPTCTGFINSVEILR